MKYSLAIILSIFLLSCSKDDSTTDEQSNNLLSPPSWIQGTWDSEPTAQGTLRYTFESSNVLEKIVQDNQEVSIIDYSILYGGDNATLTETNESDTYSIKIEVNTQLNGTAPYTAEETKIFKRLSDNQIELTPFGVSLGVIFTKR